MVILKNNFAFFLAFLPAVLYLRSRNFFDMKRLRRYLPLLALLLMLAGSIMSCRDAGVRDALQRAEALMKSDPHAARAVLDSLDLQSSSPIPNSSFLIPHS